MSRIRSVFDPLDKTADAVLDESRDQGTERTREILDTLGDGLGFLANAIGVLAWPLEKAPHPRSDSAPVHAAADAVRAAGKACTEARRALKDVAAAVYTPDELDFDMHAVAALANDSSGYGVRADVIVPSENTDATGKDAR